MRALVRLLLAVVTLAAFVAPTAFGATQPTHRVVLPIVAGRPPADASAQGRQFGYGASIADLGKYGPRLTTMSFGYVKSYLAWSGSEPTQGRYQWTTSPGANDANNIAADAERSGLKLILRVDTPPAWAAPASGNRPPSNPNDFADFMGALAGHLRGRVAAYEIYNEPNLASEWGNQRPNPEQYAQLLRAVYPRIKAADPSALVISAGMATTGGDGGVTAMNDLDYLQRLYDGGARPYFDVLGSHPYGFSTAPDVRNGNGITDFRRAADQYTLMARNGDGAKAVWATELGWLVDSGAYGHAEYLNDPLWSGRQWQKVDPQTQASYLVAAYQYAYRNWPWIGVMVLFNLDFSTVAYYPGAEPMRWYGVVNADGSPRPAFDALRGMAKPTR